jgi:heat shock protein HslJ
MRTRNLCCIFLSVGVFTLTACAAAQKGDSIGLSGQTWLLTTLNGKSIIDGTMITARFSLDGTLAGSAGCNLYKGNFETSGNSISFASPMATTLKLCEESVMAQEKSYLNTLSTVKSFKIVGNQLILTGAGDTQVAIYQAQAQELAGTTWQVLTYNNGKQAVVSVLIGTSLNVNFGSDGAISGNSGCNTYLGTYKADGEDISIGPLGSTKKYCGTPEGVMNQEAQFLAALEKASKYLIEGDSLELRTTDGTLLVKLTRQS